MFFPRFLHILVDVIFPLPQPAFLAPRLSVRPLKHPGCLGSRESRRFGWFTRWFLPLSPCSDEPRIFTWPKRSPAGSTGISCASTSSCVEPPCLPACRPVTQRQRSPFRGIVFFFQPLTNRLLKKINSPVGLRETFVVLRFVFGSIFPTGHFEC